MKNLKKNKKYQQPLNTEASSSNALIDNLGEQRVIKPKKSFWKSISNVFRIKHRKTEVPELTRDEAPGVSAAPNLIAIPEESPEIDERTEPVKKEIGEIKKSLKVFSANPTPDLAKKHKINELLEYLSHDSLNEEDITRDIKIKNEINKQKQLEVDTNRDDLDISKTDVGYAVDTTSQNHDSLNNFAVEEYSLRYEDVSDQNLAVIEEESEEYQGKQLNEGLDENLNQSLNVNLNQRFGENYSESLEYDEVNNVIRIRVNPNMNEMGHYNLTEEGYNIAISFPEDYDINKNVYVTTSSEDVSDMRRYENQQQQMDERMTQCCQAERRQGKTVNFVEDLMDDILEQTFLKTGESSDEKTSDEANDLNYNLVKPTTVEYPTFIQYLPNPIGEIPQDTSTKIPGNQQSMHMGIMEDKEDLVSDGCSKGETIENDEDVNNMPRNISQIEVEVSTQNLCILIDELGEDYGKGATTHDYSESISTPFNPLACAVSNDRSEISISYKENSRSVERKRKFLSLASNELLQKNRMIEFDKLCERQEYGCENEVNVKRRNSEISFGVYQNKKNASMKRMNEKWKFEDDVEQDDVEVKDNYLERKTDDLIIINKMKEMMQRWRTYRAERQANKDKYEFEKIDTQTYEEDSKEAEYCRPRTGLSNFIRKMDSFIAGSVADVEDTKITEDLSTSEKSDNKEMDDTRLLEEIHKELEERQILWAEKVMTYDKIEHDLQVMIDDLMVNVQELKEDYVYRGDEDSEEEEEEKEDVEPLIKFIPTKNMKVQMNFDVSFRISQAIARLTLENIFDDACRIIENREAIGELKCKNDWIIEDKTECNYNCEDKEGSKDECDNRNNVDISKQSEPELDTSDNGTEGDPEVVTNDSLEDTCTEYSFNCEGNEDENDAITNTNTNNKVSCKEDDSVLDTIDNGTESDTQVITNDSLDDSCMLLSDIYTEMCGFDSNVLSNTSSRRYIESDPIDPIDVPLPEDRLSDFYPELVTSGKSRSSQEIALKLSETNFERVMGEYKPRVFENEQIDLSNVNSLVLKVASDNGLTQNSRRVKTNASFTCPFCLEENFDDYYNQPSCSKDCTQDFELRRQNAQIDVRKQKTSVANFKEHLKVFEEEVKTILGISKTVCSETEDVRGNVDVLVLPKIKESKISLEDTYFSAASLLQIDVKSKEKLLENSSESLLDKYISCIDLNDMVVRNICANKSVDMSTENSKLRFSEDMPVFNFGNTPSKIFSSELEKKAKVNFGLTPPESEDD